MYRRLLEFGISVRDTYSDINDTSLDIAVRNICQQEYRVRESMRRVDPDGIVI